MDKAALIKQYYRNLVESVGLAEEIVSILHRIRQSSMKLDYTALDEDNQHLLAVSDQLQSHHDQRRALAKALGCDQEQFTQEVLTKINGKVRETLSQASERLKQALQDCQLKLTQQTDLLLEQQNVLHEASQTLRVEVNA